jgi:hypothetical protein
MTDKISSFLVDIVDIIFRYVPDDLAREDIYSELFHVLGGDEEVLAGALGIDTIYDSIYKEAYNEEEDNAE